MAIPSSSLRPQLGNFPKLPKKVIPGTKRTTDGTLDYKFVLSEKEKTREDYFNLKKLVYHYEWIGRQQINRHRDSIVKKFNLAYGIVDTSDYIKDQSEYAAELEFMGGESLDFDLKFYPIIPNVVNTLVGDLSKQYTNYSAIAVNREAVNSVLDEKNNMLRQLLIQPLQEQFNAQLEQQGVTQQSQPDVFQQQQELFQQMPKVQKYMAKEFRLEVENWANHTIQLDNKRFKMQDVEKEFFFNKLVTDMPYIHINLMEQDYRPQVLDPRYCSYLKTPYIDDVSESVMFMWHEYESPLNLITKWGHKLNEEDMDKLQTLHIHYRTLLNIDSRERYNLDTPGILESAQNFLAFREIANTTFNDSKYRGGEYKERLVEECHMYLQVPRKLGKLTINSGEDMFSTIVDETYTVNIDPVYDTSYTKEKTEENLVYGEHIEWFYINELWRVVKINLSTNPNPDNSDDIWLVLEKFPIQLSLPQYRFGSYIPVHGGSRTNKYNDPISLVDKCKPWQVFYNYLWNRNDQLIKGEIGKFFAFNQNAIPQESMGEEWGRHNILKWAMTARDTKLGVLDTSMANTGGTNLGLTGGFGQEVDLTVTDEVIQKAKLAELCKNEMLLQVGASPQMLGDISPSETATGINQGINRSVTQIRYLYNEHFTVFEKVRQTMLEFAKYIDMNGGITEKMYVSDEGERVIFQIPPDLAIHQLGVYVSSNLDDNALIELVRNLVLQDNTMGADLLEKVGAIASKSMGELYTKLKESATEREIKELNRIKQEQETQQKMIEAQSEQVRIKLEEEARQNQLDRESAERQTEMKVIGQAQFSEGDALTPLLKLKEIQDKEKMGYQSLLNKLNTDTQKDQIDRFKLKQTKDADGQKFDLEKEKLKLEREKIMADLKKSQNDVLIAKTNKN
jgi:hypothetical protein